MYRSYLDSIKANLENEEKQDTTDICLNCSGKLIRDNDSIMVCNDCGQMANIIGGKYDDGICHNVEGYVNLSSGKGSIFSSVSDPEKAQINAIYNTYKKKRQQQTNINIPDFIFNNAAEMYINITKHTKSSRASVLSDILGACLYHECTRAGSMYTERQIAKFMLLKKEGLSNGNKILNNLYLRGLINIDISNNIYLQFIEKYLTILEIDLKYANTLVDIIFKSRRIDSNLLSDETIKKHNLVRGRIYKIGSNCRIITKCAGIVYALTKIIDFGKKITIEQIDEIGATKKSTYGKFTTQLMKYDDLIDLTKSIKLL